MSNTAPNENTFDLDQPRRPGSADFNGLAKENANNQPVRDPVTMPSAEEWNTLGHLAIALGKVCPLAIVVINGSATPTVQDVLAPGSVVAADILVTRVGAGHIRARWLTTKLPPMKAADAGVYEDLGIDEVRCFKWTAAGAGYEGVEIKTLDGGVGTDCDVVLKVY